MRFLSRSSGETLSLSLSQLTVEMEENKTPMDTAVAEYAAFEDKVKRTVYIDNLSPQATEAVVKSALNQFGNVTAVKLIPNYIYPSNMPCSVLVEMQKSTEATNVINELADHPFMLCGMPRSVRARAAQPEMFADAPVKPGRNKHCRWLDQHDPDFTVATKLKDLSRKQTAEASFMLKRQLKEEENLAKKQALTLKTYYKKFESINGVLVDGAAKRLASRYNIKIRDD